MSVRAGIVVTGTEVLSGYVTDRNGPWVSERLGELGVEVAHIMSVGDRADDVIGALRFLSQEGMDLVVTTGGLGPTADDLTAEAVARFSGRELVLDSSMENRIAEIIRSFARRFRFDPEALQAANRKQAMVPEGAATVNPAGTAPGLVVPAEGMTVIVLPGPPRELQAMWEEALGKKPARAVLKRAESYGSFSTRLFGLPESEIAQSLREIEAETDLSDLEVTTCLRRGEVHIDVRYRDGAESAAEALRAGLAERHGAFLFSESGQSIEEVLFELLGDRKLAVAESCTGGLLAVRLSDRPGSSEHFAGGVVAYSNEAKVELLGVPAELIERHGAVSPEVAEAMADGALRRFEANVGCSVTGIAGPGGGTEEKPVGYVCFCVKLANGEKLPRDIVLPGNRDEIRDRAVAVALHLLRYLLLGRDPPR